jgi:hypothetical protein
MSASGPNNPDLSLIEEAIEKKHAQRRDAQTDRFRDIFADRLTHRAKQMNTGFELDDDDANKLDNQTTALAQLAMITPASMPWMIMRKLEILEYYLGGEDGTNWTDNREVAMLGCIKADLLRFEPQER